MGTRLNAILLPLCIAVIVVSAWIAADRTGVMPPWSAALAALAVSVIALLIHRQQSFRREIQTLQTMQTESQQDATVAEDVPVRLEPEESQTPSSPALPRAAPLVVETAEDADEEIEETVPKGPPKQDELSMLLQPVVTLPHRRPELYQASFSLRLKSGKRLGPQDLAKAAESGGLTAGLDQRMVAMASRMLTALSLQNQTARIIVPVSRTTLSDKAGLLELAKLLAAPVARDGKVVIALSQRSLGLMKKSRHAALAALSTPILLDDVADYALDLEALQEQGIRYLRSSASLLLHASGQPGAIAPEELPKRLEQAKIRLIASDVTESTMAMDLIDREIGLAQGALFAPPRPVKPSLVKAQ